MLGRHVEWVPVCPEVEIGLGTPRESLRLVGSSQRPRLITINTGQDYTQAMNVFSKRRLQELEAVGLCGFVFKKNSPSCGLERVRIYNRRGMPNRNGTGLFARAFRRSFPFLPVEEEGRLLDLSLRENFIARVFGYQRWREFLRTEPNTSAMIQFHTKHKYLLLSHSRKHYEHLGRLVADGSRYAPHVLASRYGYGFLEALAFKATVSKHADALQHIAGHLKNILTAAEKRELAAVIADYRNRLVPLIAPLILLKHFTERYGLAYLKDQVYFDPYPKEFMLRSNVT
jgi:uncharacterized protein YbgA (DUF1722 family)/uncharacterized protein YbbK (DUF523 family)